MQIEQIDAPDWFVERTPDAPRKLWVRGDPNLVFDPFGDRIAVVGARTCTKYGSALALTWSRVLAEGSFTIVSGLARGIDAAAHQGALAAGTGGGLTIAVLGCGIDRVYPAGHTGLAEQIVDMGGCIVSEYEPGVEPAPWRLAARNRIIAGLSRAMLIVEAREKSGSLIAADFALKCGTDLFAVPGEVYSLPSVGTNKLIQEHLAQLALTPDDLLPQLVPRKGGSNSMKELRAEYMQRTNGDYSAAAVELAYDLMQDDPATLKTGYTIENASIAAHEVFPKIARIAIQERVARRTGLIK